MSTVHYKIPAFSKHRIPLHVQLSLDLSFVTLRELGLEESAQENADTLDIAILDSPSSLTQESCVFCQNP